MKQYEDISLKGYNTFGIDVRCRQLIELEPGDAVPQVRKPFVVLGEGSDVVFAADYEGTVVHLAPCESVERVGADSIRVWAGMKMDALVRWTLEHGLYGLENLSAIPGTVGAAAVQNVGAYGAEAKDFITEVHTVDIQNGAERRYSAAECRFGYRTSRFKQEKSDELIVGVVFRLATEFVPNLSYRAVADMPHGTAEELREAITTLRWQKLPRPEENGSAGSFFKNPVVDEKSYMDIKAKYPDMPEAHATPEGYKISAGWIIDKAGWKGRSMGNAGVWPKNALVLYNAGGCTGSEVVALAQAIQDDVKKKFGVMLEPEAIII